MPRSQPNGTPNADLSANAKGTPMGAPNAALTGLAVLVAIAGGVFTLQGIGVPIGHSFMVGDLRWTAIGLVLVAIAAGILWRQRGGRTLR
ncbi:MAG TPA: hypothetical protein VGI98_02155 [Candidatus Limnocylindrales bacterium]|jgi:hypothetical protein